MVRVATLSVAIGVAVMIVSLAVIFGFKREITAKLSGFGAHVQIASLDGNASSYETEPVSRDQPFADYFARNPPLSRSLNPYAVKGGILRGEEAMQGIVLKGVDFDLRLDADAEEPRRRQAARRERHGPP